MTRCIHIVVSLLVVVPWEAYAAPMTLKEAIRYALGHSPVLESEGHREAIGELKLGNARAKFLPTLDLTSSHGLARAFPTSATDPWASSLSLTLKEELYDNHRSILQYRISELSRDIAALSRRKARDLLCLEVTQKFYKLSQSEKLLEVKETQLGLYQKQFRFVDDQYKQGMKTKKDYLRFRSQAQRSEIDAREARFAVERAVIELRNTMGVPPAGAAQEAVTFAPEVPKLDLAAIPESAPAAKDAFDYRLADLKRQVNPHEVQLAKREFYPTVGVALGASYSNQGYLGGGGPFTAGQTYGWQALVTVGFNFLDWGVRARNIEIAERSRDIEDNNFRKAALDVDAQIKAVMIDLSQLRTNYRMTEELLSLEEESFGVVKREYREGKVTPYDFILSLNDLLDAKTRFYNSLYGLAEGVARYHYYEGKLHDTLALQ